jgi:hypothetical protein
MLRSGGAIKAALPVAITSSCLTSAKLITWISARQIAIFSAILFCRLKTQFHVMFLLKILRQTVTKSRSLM